MMDHLDGTWIDIGQSWRRAISSWDGPRRARLLAHLRRLKAGGWNQKGACFIGHEMVIAEDEAATLEAARVGKRVIKLKGRGT